MATYTLNTDTNLASWMSSTAGYDSSDSIIVNSGAIVTIDQTLPKGLGNITIDDGDLLIDGLNATDPIHVWGRRAKAIIPAGSSGRFITTTGWYTHATTGTGLSNQTLDMTDYWEGAGAAGDFTDFINGLWLEDTVEVSYGTATSTVDPVVGDWIELRSDRSKFGKVKAVNTAAQTIQIEGFPQTLNSGDVLSIISEVDQEGPILKETWYATLTSGETLVQGEWMKMVRLNKHSSEATPTRLNSKTGQGFVNSRFSNTIDFPFKIPRSGARFRFPMITIGTINSVSDFNNQIPYWEAAENSRFDMNGSNAGTTISKGVNWGSAYCGSSNMGKYIIEDSTFSGALGNSIGNISEVKNCCIAADHSDATIKGGKLNTLDSLSGIILDDVLLFYSDGQVQGKLNVANMNDVTLRNSVLIGDFATNSNNNMIATSAVNRCTIENNEIVGAIQLNKTVDFSIKNCRITSSPLHNNDEMTHSNSRALGFIGGSDRGFVKSIRFDSMSAYQLIYQVDSFNIKVRAIGSPDYPIDLGAVRSAQPLLCSGAYDNIDIARVYMTQYTGGGTGNGAKPIKAARTGSKVTIQNIHGSYTGEIEPECNLQKWRGFTGGLDGGLNTSQGSEVDLTNVYGANAYDFFNSTTTGNLGLTFREPSSLDGSDALFTSSGGYYWDRRGRLGLYDASSVEWDTGYYALGHTGFTGNITCSTANSATKGTNSLSSNITLDFQFDLNDGNGFNGSWLDANVSSNLTNITINPSNGIRMKFRLSNNDGQLHEFIGLLVETTSTEAAQLDNMYPIDQVGVNFNGLVAGSQLVVYAAGTTNELFRENNTSTSEFYGYSSAGSDVDIDYTIIKTGQVPIRLTGVTLLDGIINNVQVTQIEDRAYLPSSGLAFGSTCSIDQVNNTFDVTTSTSVQNFYSFVVESFINETTLRNVEFPLSTFGEASYTLKLDYEFTASSLQYLKRDGFRYVETNGNIKQIYLAVLSQGVDLGLQPEYVQTQGGTVLDTQNTGNIDQVIKIFGDSNNGNFDYRDHLVFKVQSNTYRQVEFDVVATYGNLVAGLYVVALNTSSIDGLTSGDPGITGISVTDNTASPVSWDAGDGAKNYSLTITDTGSNSADSILRHFNYLLSTDGTLNGLDVFQYPELVLNSGSTYETIGGIFRKSTGDTTVGVRIVDGSGNPHPGFTRFQSDDGSYGTPPVLSQASVSGLTSGSRIQIYNLTTSTEVINTVVNSTTYTASYNNGTDYTNGDIIRVRVTYKNGTSAKLGFTAQSLASTAGWSVIADQKDDLIYNAIGVDGSNITIFEADYVDTEIDLIVSQNFGSEELYPWWVNNLYSADGIRFFFDGLIAEDRANFRVDSSTVDIMFDTDVSTNVYQNNDARIYRSDGIYPVKAPTTGGGAIDLVWRQRVFIAQTGISGLTPSESTLLNGISNLPSASDVRTEIDSNSTQLTSIKTTVEDTNADVNAIVIPTAPTVEQIRTEIDSNSTQLTSIKDTVEDVETDIANLPTAPTVQQIRTEIDSNSTQLTSIKTTVEDTNTDVNAIVIPTAPTVEQIRTEIDSNSTQLTSIKTTVEDVETDIANLPTAPTVEQIRTEIDSNSTQLTSIKDTVEDVETDIANLPTAPTVEQIRTEIDDNSTKLEAVNKVTKLIPATL